MPSYNWGLPDSYSAPGLRRVLVIDRGGFIGSHLLDRLLPETKNGVEGWDTRIEKERSSPRASQLQPRKRSHQGPRAPRKVGALDRAGRCCRQSCGDLQSSRRRHSPAGRHSVELDGRCPASGSICSPINPARAFRDQRDLRSRSLKLRRKLWPGPHRPLRARRTNHPLAHGTNGQPILHRYGLLID